MNEAAQQQKAYDEGVKMGLAPFTAKQPTDLLWEQAKTGYDDETLVCYLNGIGDALAGYRMHWSEHWNLADEVFQSPTGRVNGSRPNIQDIRPGNERLMELVGRAA